MKNLKTTLKSNWKTILIVVIFIFGLVVTLVLIQNQQVFKSKAGSEINSALNVTDENGDALLYQGNNTYQATSKKVRIEIGDVESLK
ncbi:MAG: hypothetical protein Q7R49_06270 [Candidatus Daviesbacteria bacterium]|nr:hypothetical protein [Candidatus Daviesbacteria bacterium]